MTRTRSSTRRPACRTVPRGAVTAASPSACPGTLATWAAALRRWGTALASRPTCARPTAWPERGFTVDQTFRDQTASNRPRFAQFSSTGALFLPGRAAAGGRLACCATRTSPRPTADRPPRASARSTAARSAATSSTRVQHPPVGAGARRWRPDPPGRMTLGDLRALHGADPRPTHVNYRGYDVYGMAPVLERRLDRRRGAQHPRATSTCARLDRDAGAAPLPRGERARVRRPQPLRRRPRLVNVPLDAAAVDRLRGRAGAA